MLKLLNTNPKKRMKAEELRNHIWITSDHTETITFQGRTENLNRYATDRKVEKITAQVERTLNELSITNDLIIDEEDEKELTQLAESLLDNNMEM